MRLTLAKVSNKKQRDQAAADAELKKQRKSGGSNKENDTSAPDVLGENEDNDVIF